MLKRWLVLVALSLTICVATFGDGRRRAVRNPSPPNGPCQVRGLANFFYSTDRGVTWSLNAETPTRAGAWDVAVLDGDSETLVAVVGRNIFQSDDAGCNWTLRQTIAEDIHHTLHLLPAPGGRVFLWTEDFALRYDHGELSTVPIPQAIGGLGVNPGNGEHIRILDLATGKARESFDAGATWQEIGGAAGGRINSSAFDPSDFQHILAGVQTTGIMISRDGGRTWTAGAASARAVCNLAFVPDHPNVVWATLPTQSGQALMYRSTDAGAHLNPIGTIVGLENNLCLSVLPNPRDENLAIVPLGDFFVFDAVRRTVTPWTCCGGRMDRIAYSPKDPARIYVHSGLR